MRNLTLSVPHHTIERYLDWVEDSERYNRSPAEIRLIIREGFTNTQETLPKKIPRNYRHAVEFKDPDTEESFGFYHITLWPDDKREYDLVAKTLLSLDMS